VGCPPANHLQPESAFLVNDPSSQLIPGFTGVPAPPEHPSLRQAFRLHLSVVGALMMREVKTRFGRHRLGYIWAFIEPATHIGFWFLIRSFMGMNLVVADMSPELFLATGIVPFLLFSDVAGALRNSIAGNRALLAFPRVRNIDAIASRFILESSTMLVVGFCTFALMIYYGSAGWPARWDLLALAVAGLLLLGLGFGTFNAIATLLSPAYANILGSTQRILYFTSGLMYNPEALPPEILYWLSWNPTLHGVQLFREGYSDLYHCSVASFPYLLAWGTGLLLTGLILERSTRSIMREQ